MNACFTFSLLIALLGSDPDAEKPKSADEPADQAPWVKLYGRSAAEYKLSHESNSEERLELSTTPVYRWNNASPTGGQHGAIYVWTYGGCAEAVGCIWMTQGADKRRFLGHELHSLSPVKLKAERDSPYKWSPKAGLERRVLAEAPKPAENRAGRLTQMRDIARGYSGTAKSPDDGETRDLRLLPQPVYRYDSQDKDVIDGALFALVCTLGSDPEVFLVVEDRRTDDGPRWHYALARFSHCELHVNYLEKEVWQAVRGGQDRFQNNADHTYNLHFEPVPADAPVK